LQTALRMEYLFFGWGRCGVFFTKPACSRLASEIPAYLFSSPYGMAVELSRKCEVESGKLSRFYLTFTSCPPTPLALVTDELDSGLTQSTS